MINVTVTVEGAIDSVASIRADARTIGLDLVRDVESVDVHKTSLDAQVCVERLVKIHLSLQVTGFDSVDRIGTRPERVQLIELLAANVVRLVAERIRNGLIMFNCGKIYLKGVNNEESDDD